MMAGIHEVKDDDNIPGDVAGGSMEMVTFTAIIDDIVFPDGRTKLACLGRGANLLWIRICSVVSSSNLQWKG
ncbi:hypothetical protein M758_UG196300, partial [Ceratodon purpureus]